MQIAFAPNLGRLTNAVSRDIAMDKKLSLHPVNLYPGLFLTKFCQNKCVNSYFVNVECSISPIKSMLVLFKSLYLGSPRILFAIASVFGNSPLKILLKAGIR